MRLLRTRGGRKYQLPGAESRAAGKLPARDPIAACQLNLEQLENSTSSALYPDSGLSEAEENPGSRGLRRRTRRYRARFEEYGVADLENLILPTATDSRRG